MPAWLASASSESPTYSPQLGFMVGGRANYDEGTRAGVRGWLAAQVFQQGYRV